MQAAAASGSAAEGGPAELDLATTIASFPPEVREEVLLGASEDILAQLPPAILAEAQRLRERSGARYAAIGTVPPAARSRVPSMQERLGRCSSLCTIGRIVTLAHLQLMVRHSRYQPVKWARSTNVYGAHHVSGAALIKSVGPNLFECMLACMHRGRQEALLRHLRGRGEEPGAPAFRTESSEQRNGDRLKQELINMAGKALVSIPWHPEIELFGTAAYACMHEYLGRVTVASGLSFAATYAPQCYPGNIACRPLW